MCLELVEDPAYLINPHYNKENTCVSTYFVRGRKGLIIDPGPYASVEKTLSCLNEHVRRDIKYIALTHIHLDHGGGSWRLIETLPESKLLVHPKGAPHIISPSKLEKSARSLLGNRVDEYGIIKGIPTERVIESKDDQTIELDGVTIRVLWTPGHASHHQCFYIPEKKTLFLGDAGGLYNQDKETLTPTTPPPFNPIKAVESLDKLISLKPEVLCYAHNRFISNGVSYLKKHKKQIQLWSSIVEKGLEEKLTPENIYKEITEKDPMINKKDDPINEFKERSPLISLQGFIGYYEWKRTKSK